MAGDGAARVAGQVGAGQTGAILLAAGASRRMGDVNKLLLPVDGVPMVARVAAAIGEAGLPMLVVLGWEADRVRAALAHPPPIGGREMRAERARERERCRAGKHPVEPSLSLPPVAAVPPPDGGRVGAPIFVHATDWADGMGASLATGMRAVPAHWSGAIICLGDMPFIPADLLRRLAAGLDGPDRVVVPVHDGRRGNPVGWGCAWFPRLAALTGDRGARALLADARPTLIPAGPQIHRDFDTAADFANAKAGP